MMDQMKLNARVTPATLDLVRPFEPLRLAAELQADGRWVIGYGHTRFARADAVISVADADALLRYDLSEVADALETLVKPTLEAHQFEALNAFALHIGLDNFRRSTVLRSVNAGAFEPAAAAMDLWRGAGASPRHPTPDHVTQRRVAERAHFLGRSVAQTEPPPPPEPAILDPAGIASTVTEAPAPAAAPGEDAAPAVSPPRWTPPPRVSRYLREAAPRRPEPAAVEATPPAAPVPTAPEPIPSSGLAVEAPPLEPERSDGPVEPPSAEAVIAAPRQEAPDIDAVRTPPSPPLETEAPFVGRTGVSDRTPSGYLGVTVEAPQPAVEPAPPSRRSTRLTYALVGLLGVMLFSGALVSMFRQANLANLVAGLIGVAFMAPAAGHFLFATLSGDTPRSATPSA